MSDGYAQSRAFFESRYQAFPDPWDFEGSAYEKDRYQATLAALSKSQYRRIYEPGCSVGVLTRALCDRGQEVSASDISEAAVRSARARCRGCGNVRIEQGDVRTDTPAGQFELIVFSEIGYYFTPTQLGDIARTLHDRLEPNGELLAVNWLGSSPDHLLHGDEVVDILNATLGCDPVSGSRHDGFRIDSWRRST